MDSTRRCLQATRTGAGYFTATSGATMVLFGVIGAFVAIPAFVTLPVSGGIGLIFAIAGTHYYRRSQNEREAEARRFVAALQGDRDMRDYLGARDVKQDARDAKHSGAARRPVEVEMQPLLRANRANSPSSSSSPSGTLVVQMPFFQAANPGQTLGAAAAAGAGSAATQKDMKSDKKHHMKMGG